MYDENVVDLLKFAMSHLEADLENATIPLASQAEAADVRRRTEDMDAAILRMQFPDARDRVDVLLCRLEQRGELRPYEVAMLREALEQQEETINE